MKKRGIALFVLLLLLVFSVLTMTGCVKIVKTGEEGKLTGETSFDANQNVADIWETQALPELVENAVDLSVFLGEATGDLKSLAEKYGKYSMGTSGELSYVVKGVGTVTEINQEKKAGYITVSLDGYSGAEIIRLQIGTVFKGSAVRDSLSFIKYENYQNQVEWADVAKSIHALIQENVINAADISSLPGKQVEFVGCFTVGSNEELIITPVMLKAS